MNREELLEKGLWFHGHKCPAMPMGLRVSLAAMEALGVEQRAGAGELVALVELDEEHWGIGSEVAAQGVHPHHPEMVVFGEAASPTGSGSAVEMAVWSVFPERSQ